MHEAFPFSVVKLLVDVNEMITFVKKMKRILLFLGERPSDTDLSIIMVVDIGYSQSCNNRKNKCRILM